MVTIKGHSRSSSKPRVNSGCIENNFLHLVAEVEAGVLDPRVELLHVQLLAAIIVHAAENSGRNRYLSRYKRAKMGGKILEERRLCKKRRGVR